jgi:tetratricopeptide (TPR) repeat protein
LATAGAFTALLVAATAVSIGLALWADHERVRAVKAEGESRAQKGRAEGEKTRAEGERTRAEEAKARAEEAKARAEVEKTRAEERERLAIDAVKRFGDVIRESPELKNNSALAPLRARLLKEPQEFFKRLRDRLQGDKETTPESLGRLGAASSELGALSAEIGEREGALRAYEESLAVRERLARENPDNTQFQIEVAWTHQHIAARLNEMGRRAESLAAHERARSLFERLARDHPSNVSILLKLAACENFMGRIQTHMGRLDEALASHQRARVIRARLVRDHPSDSNCLRDVALSDYYIGSLQDRLGRAEEALAAHERATRVREGLASRLPSATSYQTDLAASYDALWRLQSQTGGRAEAPATLERARTVWDRLAHEHPASAWFAGSLATTLSDMASIDLSELRFGEARARLLQATTWRRKALAADPQDARSRQLLDDHLALLIRAALGLGRTNEVVSARREQDALHRSAPGSAALDARLAAVLGGDQPPTDGSERTRLARWAYRKSLHASSARLYAEAVANDPKLASDRQAQHRYHAARAAALAGVGLGADDPGPDDNAKAKLRAQALGWLRSELSAWREFATVGPGDRRLVARTLDRWRQDTDLAGVRDAPGLAWLAEAERKEWQGFWAGVDALRASVPPE